MPNPPQQHLTFFITGSCLGHGLLLSRLVLDKGHNLIATSRSPSRTPDFVDEILSHPCPGNGSSSTSTTFPPGVINDPETSQNVDIDVLVNSAGFSIHAPAELLEGDELRDVMDTMYFGPARLMRAVLPFMRQRKREVIVNRSSGPGLEARESMGGYAAAKAALDGFSKVLAKEVASSGVRVLTIELGAFTTNMGDNARAGRRYIEEDLPGDYVGSMADEITKMLVEKNCGGVADGDPEKAVRAVDEVIVGEGVGEGKQRERMLAAFGQGCCKESEERDRRG
ncbi:hypothetical protein B0T21DRAFT_348777 [Apiosordaria backusii]|uniref:Uncharacterized protein n=1 Tax=Apiosordaria backusii TaxID=314023 RepID=A0AA40BM34_9PEZI|nr:hypothetical protein B0T21DRAFT_348777 [Apiosordaria backusii]